MKEEKHSYIKGLLHGIGTLLTGMKVTGREFFTPKVTEQYPENRATLKISPRFRGRLIMPVDENGNNKCIACRLFLSILLVYPYIVRSAPSGSLLKR